MTYEIDICPNCGQEGGEYTSILNECAFCSAPDLEETDDES